MAFLRALDQLVVPFVLLFLFVGSIGSALLGCGLLVRTGPTLRFIQAMNRWVSTRRATRELELPRSGFRRSKWLGAFLVAGGTIAGYYLVVRLQIPRDALSPTDARFFTAFAIDITRWILAAGCLVSIATGALVLFFPAPLDRLESRMNRWVSTRTLIPAGSDRMRMPLELLVESNPRAAGWIMALSSLAVAAAMGMLIFARWLR